MRIVQLNMICLELISSARDNVALRSAVSQTLDSKNQMTHYADHGFYDNYVDLKLKK